MPQTERFLTEELGGGVTVVRVSPLEEALPGVLAVFTTRLGGVSSPPWGTLNLGFHCGDSPADVTENRRRLFAALGVDTERLVTAQQVHSDTIAIAAVGGQHERTDGLLTISGGLTLAVFCADCVPVWLLDPGRPAAGAVHAGWKGSLAGIARKAVDVMVAKLGSRRSDILAAVGPSIGPCCYEVGQDVAEPFAERFGEDVFRPGEAGRSHLDLWEANRLSLLAAGLDPSHIYVSGLCTSCRDDLFHSHRRETKLAAGAGRPPRAGRMAALIRLPVVN